MLCCRIKKTYWIVIVLILTYVLVDLLLTRGFYEYTRYEFDLRRLPLIEPSEIYSTREGEPWIIDKNSNLQFIGVEISLIDPISVDSLAFFQGQILLNAKSGHYRIVDDQILNAPSSYYLLYNPRLKIGFKFDSRYELEMKVGCHQLKFEHPEVVFKKFSKNTTKSALYNLLEIQCN